jgi:hypothetical protein
MLCSFRVESLHKTNLEINMCGRVLCSIKKNIFKNKKTKKKFQRDRDKWRKTRKCGVGNGSKSWYDNDDSFLCFFVFIKRAYTHLRATKIDHNNNNDDDDDCSSIFENESLFCWRFYAEICRLTKRIVNRQIARRKTTCGRFWMLGLPP